MANEQMDLGSQEPKRGFTGFFIPVEILDDERLRNSDKLLLAEIDSLSKNEHKACYASNTYLARHLQMTPGGVANAISRLRALGYIEDMGTDGRKRWIRLAPLRLSQTSSNDEGSVHQKMNINTKRKTKVIKVAPDFDEPELQREWEAWQLHRRQRNNPITAEARIRQLDKLRKLGPVRALAALRFSIECGYTGIYEPKEQKDGKAPAMPRHHRENKINYLNRRKAELLRQKQTPEVERELTRIQIELHKL